MNRFQDHMSNNRKSYGTLPVFRLVVVFAFLFALLTTSIATSQEKSAQKKYPEIQSEFLSDDADLVDLDARRQISRDLRNIVDDSKIHVVLAVIQKMGDYPDLPQDIAKFGEALAEHWKLGEKRSKQGILVLFSIDDRKFSVNKTAEMSTRLTEDIKEGMSGLPRTALRQGNVSLAMKRAANVLVELVPDANSEKGVKNIMPTEAGNKKSTTTRNNNRNPPTRVIRQERRNNGGGGFPVGGLICVGIAGVMIFMALAGVGVAASRGFGGGGYYGGGYHGGGGGFLSGMITGSILNGMFGGHHGGSHTEHHYHYDHGGGGGGYDDGGGGYDGGGYDGGGGFDYGAETFGGGDFDGGSVGEW